MLLFLSSKCSVQIRLLLHQHAGVIAVYWGSPRPLRLYLDSAILLINKGVQMKLVNISSYLHFILFIVQPFLRSNIKELMNFTALLVLNLSCHAFSAYIYTIIFWKLDTTRPLYSAFTCILHPAALHFSLAWCSETQQSLNSPLFS